jgi:hypothetical protein
MAMLRNRVILSNFKNLNSFAKNLPKIGNDNFGYRDQEKCREFRDVG